MIKRVSLLIRESQGCCAFDIVLDSFPDAEGIGLELLWMDSEDGLVVRCACTKSIPSKMIGKSLPCGFDGHRIKRGLETTCPAILVLSIDVFLDSRTETYFSGDFTVRPKAKDWRV